jgi:hypothetical protein
MAVSIKRHNEEAAGRPVDKKKVVDMPENHSKTGERFDNKQPGEKLIGRGERTSLFCVFTIWSGSEATWSTAPTWE